MPKSKAEKKPDQAEMKTKHAALVAEREALFPEVKEALAAYEKAKRQFADDLAKTETDVDFARKEAVASGKDWATNRVPGVQMAKQALMTAFQTLFPSHDPRGYRPPVFEDVEQKLLEWQEARARWNAVKTGHAALVSEAQVSQAQGTLSDVLVALPADRLAAFVKKQITIAELEQKLKA